MRYRNIIIGIGFFVLIIKILGVPQDWRDVLYTIAGLSVIAVAYISEKKAPVANHLP